MVSCCTAHATMSTQNCTTWYQNDTFFLRKLCVCNITLVMSKSPQMNYSVSEPIWWDCYNEESWINLGFLFPVRSAMCASLQQWHYFGVSSSTRSSSCLLMPKKHHSCMSGWGHEPPRRDNRLGQGQPHPQQGGELRPTQSHDPSSCHWSSFQLGGDTDTQWFFLKHTVSLQKCTVLSSPEQNPRLVLQGLPKVPSSPTVCQPR